MPLPGRGSLARSLALLAEFFSHPSENLLRASLEMYLAKAAPADADAEFLPAASRSDSGEAHPSFPSCRLCLLQLLTWEPRRDQDVAMVIVRPNFQDSVHVGYVTGLKKFTEYYTSVLCFTTPGDGPRSPPRAARTHEDSEFFSAHTSAGRHPLFIELCGSANDIPAGSVVIGPDPRRLLAPRRFSSVCHQTVLPAITVFVPRFYVNTFKMQTFPAFRLCPARLRVNLLGL